MSRLCPKHECCGCSACVSVCPRSCISMVADSEGFFYPSVNASECINCHLCTNVCPALAQLTDIKPQGVFASHNIDNNIVKISSSGGVFSVLAKHVISKKGMVYGAEYDEMMNVVFSTADTEEKTNKIRGSKYVQARINDCFKDVRLKLQQDVDVLFTGTPCQVAGLKSFLRKPYENLFTMEVVCHGVPSEKVWQKHLQVIKAKHLDNRNVKNVVFRYKEEDWRSYKICYSTQDGASYLTVRGDDAYFRGFVRCLYTRPSCEMCLYKNGASGADLTVGDLWGVERILKDGGNSLGESLVIANTEKGMKLLRQNAELLSMKAIDLADAKPYNEGLLEHALPHRNRNSFFQMIDATEDIDALIDGMLKPNVSERLKEEKIKIMTLVDRVTCKVYKFYKKISS